MRSAVPVSVDVSVPVDRGALAVGSVDEHHCSTGKKHLERTVFFQLEAGAGMELFAALVVAVADLCVVTSVELGMGSSSKNKPLHHLESVAVERWSMSWPLDRFAWHIAAFDC